MKIDRETDILTGASIWTITILPREFDTAPITQSDRLLLAECASPEATVADTLLGLELIARRIEEAQIPA